MSDAYYEPSDLDDFPNIGEHAAEAGAKSLGLSNDEMMEAAHVGAAMVAGREWNGRSWDVPRGTSPIHSWPSIHSSRLRRRY